MQNTRNKNGSSNDDDTIVYRYGIKDNIAKGLGIASFLGVIGFAAFKGYSKLKELERLKSELEAELAKK